MVLKMKRDQVRGVWRDLNDDKKENGERKERNRGGEERSIG